MNLLKPPLYLSIKLRGDKMKEVDKVSMGITRCKLNSFLSLSSMMKGTFIIEAILSKKINMSHELLQPISALNLMIIARCIFMSFG